MMLTKVVQPSAVILLSALVSFAQVVTPSKSNRLLVQLVKFRLVAEDIKYEGLEAERGDVCVDDDALPFRGRNYYRSDAGKDGLFEEAGNASKIYQPFDLAAKAGWYTAVREDDNTSNNIWGLLQSGDRIWMGSDGLGILSFDPQRRLWSRYDWQYEAQTDALTHLNFVDEKFFFFVGKGSRFVCSRQYQACAQMALPLDPGIDDSQSPSGVGYLKFKSPEAKQNYYVELESEFIRLKSGDAKPAKQQARALFP